MTALRLALSVVALSLFAGCAQDERIFTNGYVKLRFVRGESQTANPYVSTTRVTVSMDYQTCLQDYYDADPDQRQDGRDGELVFGPADLGGEGWQDRLCEDLESSQAACSINKITQELEMGIPHITVEYNLTAPELEGRVLLFGPLPTSETADCADPEVRVSSSLPSGYNGPGDQIWIAENISPTKAYTNQGGDIVIKSKVN